MVFNLWVVLTSEDQSALRTLTAFPGNSAVIKMDGARKHSWTRFLPERFRAA
jgi:hypothetical protein